METKFGGRYKIGKKLGHGAFGDIHIAYDITLGVQVAVKIENCIKSKHRPQLLLESNVYKELQGAKGIPTLHWIGTEGENTYMVIDLLGPSLESIFATCNRRFTLKTTLLLTDQALQRIEYFHTKGYLHRDIKPDNFVMGIGKSQNELFIIDYGLSKRYRDKQTKCHIPFRNNKKLTGTARYCSLSTHLGIEQSRRDDLEGLAYCLIYFLKGELPWQGIRVSNKKKKYEKIMDKKMNMSIEALTKDLPNEFASFLYYCRSLKFDEKPDYAYCRKSFYDLYQKNKFGPNISFDWVFTNDAIKKKDSNAFLSNHIDNSENKDEAKEPDKGKIPQVVLEQGNAKSLSKEKNNVKVLDSSFIEKDLQVPSEHEMDEIAEENIIPIKIEIPQTRQINNSIRLRSIIFEYAKTACRDRKFKTKSTISKFSEYTPYRKATGSIYY